MATSTSTPRLMAVDLRPVRDAAVHDGDGEAGVAAVGLEAVGDLRRKLARRRQHEHARMVARRRPAVGGEAVQDRQREGRGLAGARLRDAHQVAAGDHARDRLRLDRGRYRVALGGERLEEVGVETQLGECGQFHIFHVRPSAPDSRNHFGRTQANAAVQEMPRVAWAIIESGISEALNRRTQEADGLGSGARSRGWSADVRHELLEAMRAYLMLGRK